jgi:hypothetical protein
MVDRTNVLLWLVGRYWRTPWGTTMLYVWHGKWIGDVTKKSRMASWLFHSRQTRGIYFVAPPCRLGLDGKGHVQKNKHRPKIEMFRLSSAFILLLIKGNIKLGCGIYKNLTRTPSILSWFTGNEMIDRNVPHMVGWPLLKNVLRHNHAIPDMASGYGYGTNKSMVDSWLILSRQTRKIYFVTPQCRVGFCKNENGPCPKK